MPPYPSRTANFTQRRSVRSSSNSSTVLGFSSTNVIIGSAGSLTRDNEYR